MKTPEKMSDTDIDEIGLKLLGTGSYGGNTDREFARAIEAKRDLEWIEMQEKQDPAAAQHRFRHPQKGTPDWSAWQPTTIGDRPAWEIDTHGWEVEYRALYAHPSPEEVAALKAEIEALRVLLGEWVDHGWSKGREAKTLVILKRED